MAMLSAAGCIVMADRFHPRSWWADVAATRATIIHYLGIMPPLLLSLPQAPEDRAHSVRFGAGAGIDPKHHEAFEARFGFPLIEGWGMTEVAMPTWASVEPRQTDTRAFGRPLSGCEVRVVDDEDQEVPPGEPGELTLRMTGEDPKRGLFFGYLKDAQATADAWRGGWFHTGDVVTRAADGMLCFVDRKKNLIRRSGENIAAAEVEAVLQADGRVAQAAVIAVPDELRQEEVMACIVPAQGVGADVDAAEALQDLCLERLAYYKAPGYLLFLDTLPVTSTQKVQKVRLFPADVDPRRVAGLLRPAGAQARAVAPGFRDGSAPCYTRRPGSKAHTASRGGWSAGTSRMNAERKVALVTGAGQGIGKAAAHALLEDGWAVVFSGRRRETLESAIAEAGAGSDAAIAVPCDVGKQDEVAALFAETRSAFGRLDLLFNNAGISAPPVPLEDLRFDKWQQVVDTNLTGVFLCTQEAFRIMKAQEPMGGRIVNNGSISAHVPRPNSAPYTSTKHAVTGLTRSTSLDGRRYNIACGQIDVGNAATEMTQRMSQGVPQADGSVASEDTMAVENVAQAVVYMARLPLDANVQFMTVMATKMPFIGRG